MQCKHRPVDSRLIISTEFGKFYAFDQIQKCKKCGKRIEMSYKWLYKIVIILALLVHFLCLLLLDVARINKDWSKVAIYAAILILIFVWTTCFSCGIMPWHEKK